MRVTSNYIKINRNTLLCLTSCDVISQIFEFWASYSLDLQHTLASTNTRAHTQKIHRYRHKIPFKTGCVREYGSWTLHCTLNKPLGMFSCDKSSLSFYTDSRETSLEVFWFDYVNSACIAYTDMKASKLQWTHEGTQELPITPLETACSWEERWKEAREDWQ